MELSNQESALFRRYIQNLCGITVSGDKSYLIQQRLGPIVVDAGCKGFGEFYQMLKHFPRPKLEEQIINAITTKETSFFRDEHPFIIIFQYNTINRIKL